jgi:cation transport ATPase
VSPDGSVRPPGRARPAKRQGSGLPIAILHETATRLRVRLASGGDLSHARVALETLDGVRSVRISPSTRSIAFDYDGRSSTRAAVLERLAAPVPTDAVTSLPRRDAVSFPLEVPLVAASLAPLLPAPARSAVALALVAGRSLSALRTGGDVAATALDAVSLATAALTGHPLTATASVAMGALAEQRRDAMLRETDRLLAQLAPASARSYDAERAGEPLEVAADDVQTGDEAWLDIGAVVPADGIVISGQADVLTPLLAAATNRTIRRGARVESGTTVRAGRIRIRFERPAATSRSARLNDHVRHVLRTRDAPGPLTPDLERLVALPVTAAGLLLALTGDAARTATMLQADPQTGIALAQPVAREAALYATARSGALLSGLESLDRLATATSFAFEDVGVLADARWYVERVTPHAGAADPAAARHWLSRLAGYRDDRLIDAGLPDARVAAWREHGALLRLPDRTLHIGGAVLVARTWGLPMPEPDRRSLVRRLGIVEDGRLLATVHLGCRLRPRVMAHLAELRALGVRRIAVFTEDPTARPALALTRLGADDVVSHDRRSQERWLDEAVEQGERVALVHTGLRDLLPPGGLSLCPVDADAGAHGVLLGDPLASLVSARRAAMTVRRALRQRFGRSVTLNAGLMIAAAMRWLPPIAIASIKHGLNVLLLEESAGLARLDAPTHGANDSNLREGEVS